MKRKLQEEIKCVKEYETKLTVVPFIYLFDLFCAGIDIADLRRIDEAFAEYTPAIKLLEQDREKDKKYREDRHWKTEAGKYERIQGDVDDLFQGFTYLVCNGYSADDILLILTAAVNCRAKLWRPYTGSWFRYNQHFPVFVDYYADKPVEKLKKALENNVKAQSFPIISDILDALAKETGGDRAADLVWCDLPDEKLDVLRKVAKETNTMVSAFRAETKMVQYTDYLHVIRLSFYTSSQCDIDKDSTFDTGKVNPAKTGYNFVGWTTEKDGGTFYADKAEVSALTTEDEGNVDLYAQWEDVTAPPITFTARKADNKDVKDGDLPLAKDQVEYTIKVTDEGTGVDADSVQYALPDKDTDTSDKTKLSYTDAKGKYDKENHTYTFTVTTSVQGFVVVKASDLNDKAHTENPETGSEYSITDGTPNTGYSEVSALVLEKTKPVLDVTVADEKLPRQSHEITYDVSDSTKPYSGIQKVTYTLKKGDDTVIGETALIDNSQSAPKELSDIEKIKEYKDQKISFDSGAYNGTYTLTVTAVDWCGNETSADKKILYDNLATAADITMDGGKESGGINYYKASNGDITVKLYPDEEDENPSDIASYKITLTNGDKTYSVSQPEGYTGKTEDTITIKEADYQKQTGDGTITASVEVTDAAGNAADSFTTITGLRADAEKKAPSFFLDTAKPNIAVTMEGGAYFDDDKNYYYGSANGTVTVAIGREDAENTNASNLDSCTITLTGPDGTYTSEKKSEVGSRNTEITITPDEYKGETGSGEITVAVTANDLSQNTNNSPDSITGLTADGGFIIFLIFWKRRKKEEEEQA